MEWRNSKNKREKQRILKIIEGGLTVIIRKNFLSFTGLYEIVPGFILSWIVIMVVSYLDKEPSQEIKQEFERAVGK